MNQLNNQSYPLENEFHQYLGIILRRRWVVITFFIITVTLVTIAQFKAKHIYRATAQLLIEKEYSSSPYREGVAVDISGMDYYQTQYKILKSRTLAKTVIDDLNLANNPEFKTEDNSVDKFLNHIIIEPIRNSRLVNLSAESFSPELATKIANTLANAYVKQNLENRLFASKEILQKLPANVSLSNLSDQDIMESLPSVVSNPLIQSIKEDLIRLESEYANLSKRYKSKHPAMLTLMAKINHLKGRLNFEMQNTVESVKTELSGAFKANNVRIIDYAEVPKYPVSPKRKRNIALASFLGLVIGIGLAFFFEYMDNTFKSGSDIEQHLDIPFLGMLPAIKDKKETERYIIENVKTPQAESIKTIRTNLTFSAPEEKLKTILITSCAPSEGKTFASMNIASSFCQTGKKTLLIDADLRRTSLTNIFKLNKSAGLSNYLIGEANINQIIKETEIKNLSFISAGTHTPDPAELLGSEKMKELINQLKSQFDRVIFDSAPVLPVSDTLNIASLMDGIVMIIYSGKLNRNLVNLGKQKLYSVKSKIIGVILNHVNIKSRGYHGYNYYSYGYSYGEYY